MPGTAVEEEEDGQVVPDNPLTTKEGWRQFVEAEPSPPDLLDAPALAELDEAERAAYHEARIDYHIGLPLVNTPVIRKVVGTSRLLIQLNRHQVSARRGIVVSGASGTGKTTALSQLGRAHELAARKRHPADPRRLPLVYITVPPGRDPADGRGRVRPVLRAAGDTVGEPHRRDQRRLRHRRPHLGGPGAGRNPQHQPRHPRRRGSVGHAEVLRQRLPATFVFAGLDADETGLFAGPRGRQIAGRFTLIDSRPFDYGTAGQKDAWRSLVAAMEASLLLHDHKPGTLAKMGEYLFGRTGGAIGSLSQLVRGAAVLAIENGAEQVTRELLDLVPVDHAAQRSASLRARRKPRAKR